MARYGSARPVTVTFHVAEPDSAAPSWTREFPSAEVLDTVAAFDLATGDYHLQTTLFGNEVFCMVHEGPVRLLASYTKDSLQAVLSEYKGTVEHIPMRDGEGILDAAYAAFFPNNVLGLVRYSAKSPGASSIAHWLSAFGGHGLYLAALPKSNAMAGLDRPADEVVSVVLRARKTIAKYVRPVRQDVAGALEAVAAVSATSRVAVEFGVSSPKEKGVWWPGMRAAIKDLADAQLIAEFDAAYVRMNSGGNVNLKQAYVTAKPLMDRRDKKRFGPAQAAELLTKAYQDEERTILAALDAWQTANDRRRRGNGGS